MKIIEIKELGINDIKVIKFARFTDHRGYFTETFRKSDLSSNIATGFLKDMDFKQYNESFSREGTIRGLHFQWSPFMDKLVRTIQGEMVDIFLDIRKGSPTFGKAAMYNMPTNEINNFSEWIWIPRGFAHGNYFKTNTIIEYFCSGEYSQNNEAAISPLAKDIDWSLCDKKLKSEFDNIAKTTKFISLKDKNAYSFNDWISDKRSDNFIYKKD